MGDKTAVRAPDRRLVLHVVLQKPAMTGFAYEGPAWKPFCFLDVHLDGKRRGTWMLPLEHGQVRHWEQSLSLPVDCCQWPRLSLDLEVQRRDYYDRRSYMGVSPVVFRTEEPHTSGHTAMLGAARVPLLDALALGDDSDEEADEKKRRLERDTGWNLVEGTRVFQGKVKLHGWRAPRPEDVELVNVVCGDVNVCMCLTEVEDSD